MLLFDSAHYFPATEYFRIFFPLHFDFPDYLFVQGTKKKLLPAMEIIAAEKFPYLRYSVRFYMYLFIPNFLQARVLCVFTALTATT